MKLNRITVALSVAALASVASAQSYRYSPSAIFASGEGSGSCTLFGAYAEGRHQIADGNFTGSSQTIKALSYRHDHYSYQFDSGMGRDWSSVTISMSECDLGKFGTTYTANAASSPTQVFGGRVTFPIQLGAPLTAPATWAISFPFSKAWLYPGNKDMLTDFRFSGGTLSNYLSWSGTQQVPYYLDSFSVGSIASSHGVTIGNVNGGCRDSNSTSGVGASVNLDTTTYASNSAIFVSATGLDFPPNQFVMLLMTFGADVNGFGFPGISCNNVHINVSRTLFLNPLKSNSVGAIPSYSFGLPGGWATYNPSWPGIDLTIQGVWNDTVTSALQLSSASRNVLVPKPPYANAGEVKLKAAFGPGLNSTSASYLRIGDPASTPILQITN